MLFLHLKLHFRKNQFMVDINLRVVKKKFFEDTGEFKNVRLVRTLMKSKRKHDRSGENHLKLKRNLMST
jgi:hypothetical protein